MIYARDRYYTEATADFLAGPATADLWRPLTARSVPLHVRSRLLPVTTRIVQYREGGTFQLDSTYAYEAILVGAAFLRATGGLHRWQTLGQPVPHDTYVHYEILDTAEMTRWRRVLAEIPLGRQRISEKQALSRCALPEDLVYLLHDFVWPVDRRQKY